MAVVNVLEFTDQIFETEVLKADVPVLVEFTATWCGPCKVLASITEKIADDYAGKIKVGRVDIDASPEISRKCGVRSVPTILIFKDGGKMGQVAGLTTYEQLIALLGV